MVVVLPQGRFNNTTDKYIREFLSEHVRIMAVVGLQRNTFAQGVFMTSEIMNGEQLQALILSGEGQLLEFKRSGTSHLGREICVFANSIGGKLELPEGALGEALLNAMGHRDYRVPGDLQVHIFQDRVEISNPGGLVGGLTLETLGTRSIPRNPLLFDMMLRMDLVEKVGSGLKRIRAMCEEYPCQHKIYADHDWFSMTFLRASTKLNTRAVPEVTPQVAPQVTPQVMLLLEAAAEPQSAAYLQKLINLKDRVHFLKSYIEPLLEIAWIERTIPDKPRSSKKKYRLTKKGFQVLNNETNNE